MMEKRILGRTGAELSVIGFGGIVVRDVSPESAAEHVVQAIERGINYFDVAPGYGNAEERLGPALEPYRDRVFLACKTGQRSAGEAKRELNRSLERLRTDHFDLYQFHAVSSVEQAEEILAPGGALECFVTARAQGLIRHIGFSAHCEAAALRLLEAFPFDSMLLPINLLCWRDGGFGRRACEAARDRGTGILALKALAKRPVREGEKKKWPKCWYVPFDTLAEASLALEFTLSKPVTAAVSPGHAELLWLACDALSALRDRPEGDPLQADIPGAPIFRTNDVGKTAANKAPQNTAHQGNRGLDR
jgi:aryl-alcohol dehydrogenase-like predicted oxidoreductase